MTPRIPQSLCATARKSPVTELLTAMSSLTITRPSVIKSTLHCLQSRSASILSSLSDTPGSYSLKKRRGRGPSSGRGKTSGRGHKGQKQHGKVPARFQGGQTPQWASKQIKGEGSEQNFTVEMSTVNLNKIQEWIRAGRLDPSRPITIKELAKSRCLHGVKDGVKLLAKGNFTLKSPINILVSRASASAIAAVEAAGGSVTTRYYTKSSIKKILSGEAENSFLPLADVANMGRLTANQRKMEALLSCSADRMANPLASRLPDATSRKDIEYYRDEKHRGYLSHLVEKGHGPSLFFKTPGTGTVRSKVKKSGSTTAAENKLW